MALSDLSTPNSGLNTVAANVAHKLTRLRNTARNSMKNLTEFVNSQDKAALCADLGTTDCQEAVDMINTLVALANEHPGDNPLVVPALVQNDVP